MAWKIKIDPKAEKDLSKLDRKAALRIAKFLLERVATLEDPRSIGEALQGPVLGDLWKYRVGNYRIFCDIQDELVIVLALRVAHRREVYRRTH